MLICTPVRKYSLRCSRKLLVRDQTCPGTELQFPAKENVISWDAINVYQPSFIFVAEPEFGFFANRKLKLNWCNHCKIALIE